MLIHIQIGKTLSNGGVIELKGRGLKLSLCRLSLGAVVYNVWKQTKMILTWESTRLEDYGQRKIYFDKGKCGIMQMMEFTDKDSGDCEVQLLILLFVFSWSVNLKFFSCKFSFI